MSDNLRLRKTVYERQNDLEKAINEQQWMPESGDAGLPPAPEGFDLPLRGKEFRFVKLIAMGEKTSVRATYVDRRLLVIVIILVAVWPGRVSSGTGACCGISSAGSGRGQTIGETRTGRRRVPEASRNCGAALCAPHRCHPIGPGVLENSVRKRP